MVSFFKPCTAPPPVNSLYHSKAEKFEMSKAERLEVSKAENLEVNKASGLQAVFEREKRGQTILDCVCVKVEARSVSVRKMANTRGVRHK